MSLKKAISAAIDIITQPVTAGPIPQTPKASPQKTTKKHARIVRPKVAIINFLPYLGTQPITASLWWSNPFQLITEFLNAVDVCSSGRLAYRIVEQRTVPLFPPLENGEVYDMTSYLPVLHDDTKAKRDVFGNYVMADYDKILREFGIYQMIDAGSVDEVWLFGGPYMGFWESRWVGRDGYFVNAPELNVDHRPVIVMGFNYERKVDQMLHAFGHRIEFMLAHRIKEAWGIWTHKFGTVHTAPGLSGDYVYPPTTDGRDPHDVYIRAWLSNIITYWWQYLVP